MTVGRYLPDERAWQLESVDRQPPQVGEVGVAGAEVIDRNPHAHAGQLLQGVKRSAPGLHQRTFGQFELEQVWRELGLFEDPGHVIDQVRGCGLAHGQVHADIWG